MYQKILLRFGELSLKGKNQKIFIRKLVKNIKQLTNIEPELKYDHILVPYSESNLSKLKYIFGIYSFSPIILTELDFAKIEEQVLFLAKKYEDKSFKVITKRVNKKFSLSSQEVSAKIGAHVAKECPLLKVNVRNPQVKLEIEIRDNYVLIFDQRILGAGGLPTGVNGKVLHLISGGIDSPVAAYEMMKRGIHVDFLNFITPPHTDQKTVDKIYQIVNQLVKYQGEALIYQANFIDLMNLIGLVSNQSYKINLMRRSFYRIANQIALDHKYLGIANGENLGQVASQTLESIATINNQTNLPIYRPLLTRDKLDTIKQAKMIDTYHISILKANETCEIFAPKEPVTKPNELVAQKLEHELEFLPNLEKEIFSKIKKSKVFFTNEK